MKNPFPALAATTLVMASSFARASIISWDGSDSTAWTSGANWAGGVAPADSLVTDIASFNLATYPHGPDVGTTRINGISVGGGSGALAVGGTSLSIGSSGISLASGAGAVTIAAPVTVGSDWQAWTNSSSNPLSVGSISRTAGTGVNFAPGGGGISTTNTNTNGILGAWATLGNGGGSGATADWAAVDGSGNIVAYTGYTTVSTGSATSILLDGSQAALNYKAGNSPTLSGTSYTTTWSTSGGGVGTIHSLVVVNDNSVSSGSTLSLGSGGLILNGVSRWILNNGTGSTAGTGQLTSGLAGGELFVDVASSASDASNWRVWTKIVDNGGTAVSLVKSGPGDLGLLNSNSYTGGTYLNSGTLSLANGGSLGAGTIRMNGGALNIRYAGGNVDLANDIVLSGSSNEIYLGVARNLGLNGALSGSGTLTLGNSNHNSTIWLAGENSMTSGTITTANNTNSVRISNAAAGNANVAWVFNNTSANRNTLDFTTGTISFGSLSGNGLLQANNITGTKTISVGGLNMDSTFSGAIGGGSGVIVLTKVGSGTLTLSGANTYTGATNVDAGTLLVTNASGSGTGSGSVNVGASGTLGGTGIIATGGGGVAVDGTIAAGNSPGAAGMLTLTAATTFNDGSIFAWDISANGASYDKLKTNSLSDGGSAGGSIFRIVLADTTFADGFWDAARSWSNIFTTDGTNPIANWANLFTTLQIVDSSGSAVSPAAGTFSLGGNTLTWTAVPEPGSALAGLLIGAGLLRRRRGR